MKHYYETIQGWFHFAEPYREAIAAAQDGSVFVELGCWKGRSSCFLLVEAKNSGKKIKIHFVDHFLGSSEHQPLEDASIFDVFKKNAAKAKYADASIIRSSTVDAAKQFDDESVDFVWIDAGHEYEEVRADIAAWWPKLKPGGVMGGDDIEMDGVKRAVSERFPTFEKKSSEGWSWWRVTKRI